MQYRTITLKVPTFALPKIDLPFTIRIERKRREAPPADQKSDEKPKAKRRPKATI